MNKKLLVRTAREGVQDDMEVIFSEVLRQERLAALDDRMEAALKRDGKSKKSPTSPPRQVDHKGSGRLGRSKATIRMARRNPQKPKSAGQSEGSGGGTTGAILRALPGVFILICGGLTLAALGLFAQLVARTVLR